MNKPYPNESPYMPSEKDKQNIGNNFVYHPPKDNQPGRYNLIRENAREFAELLAMLCPTSRELSLALTKLEESVFWANASIARNELEKNLP